ncbi:ABC transporter permease subunit [Polyangium spumosum]|uniref:ABC transporter permease subunit n=1 Tax=Polyangium spumosum TaxID=889282 RepID=UPI0014794870
MINKEQSLEAPAARPSGKNAQWTRSTLARALFSLALVLALGVVFPAEGAFFRLGTHQGAWRQASVVGILACGLLPVILAGGIDLSVGSVLGLSAVVAAKLSIHEGAPAWLSVFCVLAIGATCGAASGAVVAFARVQPFVATLAMMVFARGLAKTASGGTKVATAVPGPDGALHYVDVPPLFRALDAQVFGGDVAAVTLVFLAIAVVVGFFCARHRIGRYWYAVGGNEEAARLSGVPVRATKILAYVISGLCAAAAGICQAAQEQQGDPEAGVTYELTAIAMVVIGGTSLKGGRGGMGLTLLGILTIGYLDKILSINAVPEASRLMLTGAIVIVAAVAQKNS